MTSWKTRAVGMAAVVVAALSTAAPAQADPRVSGEIGSAYEDRYDGARGFLGEPLTPEIRTPNGQGAYVVFQNGSIYWSWGTGAHEVHGQIREGWGRLGWENGLLGFPVGDEEVTSSRRGRYQDFDGARMYWTPQTGAHELHGAIEQFYEDSYRKGLWEDAEEVLGFPTTSEVRTPNGRGAYNVFQRGSIYWSPSTGVHPVYGAIGDAWASVLSR